jgi:hypothetical protein
MLRRMQRAALPALRLCEKDVKPTPPANKQAETIGRIHAAANE